MSSRSDMIERAKVLEKEAKRLRKEAHDSRPLPRVWCVGQKVRYLKDEEYAWSGGSTAYIKKLRPEYEGKPAKEYQVFYTGQPFSNSFYWTTPDDVELVDEGG